MRRLRIQHLKLERVQIRLNQRDKTLFKACTFALEKKNKERAAMCANELAEVRKLLNILSQTQIAIERIILRLETIKELSTIMVDLKPALSVLKNLTSGIVNVMPDIASELDNVNRSIQDTLIVTKVSSELPIIQTSLKTPGGQEILEEVNAFLEQRITEQLPQPPTSDIIPETPQEQEVRRMVALAVGYPESINKSENQRSETLPINNFEMQRKPLEIQNNEPVEEKLLHYIKECKGQINMTECALRLKIPPNQIREILEILDSKGKIIMEK